MTDTLNGHTCNGYIRFVVDSETAHCKPNIDEELLINGCDDYSKVPISHCPFCGAKLKELVKS